MSTRGSVVSMRGDLVGARRHDVEDARPGCRCARRRAGPSSQATHGVSGAGLSTTVQPAASAGPTLARLIWVGTFHGVIAATTPTGSRRTVRRRRDAHRLRDAEVGLELVGLQQVGDPLQALDRYVEAGGAHHEAGHADLGGGQRPERVGVVEQRLVQLAQAAHPQLDVRRPVGLVEGPAGRGDRGLDVRGGAVGCLPDLLARGRVEDRVRRAVATRRRACRRSAAAAGAGGRSLMRPAPAAG